MSEAFLGIDLGTGSVKAVVVDAAGVGLGRASVPYTVEAPQPGFAEGDCEVWWKAVARAVGEAITASSGVRVAGIGVTGQMHGVVLVDREGVAVRPPILWPDTRARDLGGAFDEARDLLGNPFVPGTAGPILTWLAAAEPRMLARARWALQPKDWLRLRLTGEVGTDPSDASATLLYDIHLQGWAADLLGDLGVSHALLPEIHRSDAVAGGLLPAVASQLGLRASIPVAVGAADTAASQIGAGLAPTGQAQLTIGTGGQIVALTGNRPLPHPEGQTHAYRSATATGWYAMAAIQSAGLALERALALTASTWNDFNAALLAVPPGARGVTFIPHVAGARSPLMDPDTRAGWVGIGLIHERADLLRAAGEGVAFTLRDALEALLPLGLEVNQIRLAGGGVSHPAWRQLLADSLERPLALVDMPDASARGAALVAAVAEDHIGSVEGASRLAPDPQPDARPESSLDAAYAAFHRQQVSLTWGDRD